MTRKPIQLIDFDGYLHALCDDGSMWQFGSPGWTKMEAIPQDEADLTGVLGDPPSVTLNLDESGNRQGEPIYPWPPELDAMDLWYLDAGGKACRVSDGMTFLEAVEKRVEMVAAFFEGNAVVLLHHRHKTDESLTFTYAGATFTFPSDPIPF